MSDTAAGAEVLTRLYETVEGRRAADPESSYTASLFAAGLKGIAAKVGEEAGETLHAALNQDARALASESADLLYHLVVLWAASGVRPDDVFSVLARREGVSGHAEKASRGT